MFRVLVAGSLVFISMTALAESPAAPAPASAQTLGGAQVPGVCLLSQQAMVTNAKVGQAATARLKVLAEQAQAEVDIERKPITADAQALQGQQATLKPQEYQQKQQALAQRLQALEQKARQRSQEIELTRQKALVKISEEAKPVIASVYKEHKCGLLVDRNAILGGNMGGDLTADVVKGLDGRISTITFDRETLPAPTASTAH
jgi:Skp family chaperone for outer membrane proteins